MYKRQALVIIPSQDVTAIFEHPEISVMEGLEKILLVPSGKNNQSLYEKLDCETLLKTINQDEDEGIIFPIPWLIEREKVDVLEGEILSNQPCLVRESPREIDLLIVDQDNIVDVSDVLPKCSGIVLNLESLPKMNDAEVEALIVSLRSKIKKKSIVMLRDRVDRVCLLYTSPSPRD